MKKTVSLILIITLLLFLFVSCDLVDAAKAVLPKFDMHLPNNISGKYIAFENEDERFEEDSNYQEMFIFNSTDDTFTETTAVNSSELTVTKKGTYSITYKTYAITECNGTIVFTYEDESQDEREFYFYATATDGPDYIQLDEKTYYYWGK